MHQYVKDGILENLDTTPRVKLGSVLGVPITATGYAWVNPVIAGGLGLARSLRQDKTFPARLADALSLALALQAANVIHAGGHIVSGKLAGSPMDELVLTATRYANRYEGDQSAYPAAVHVGRAVGGPIANLAAAGLLGLLAARLPAGFGRDFSTQAAAINRAVGLGSLLPLPPVDGGIIWRAAWHALRRQATHASNPMT